MVLGAVRGPTLVVDVSRGRSSMRPSLAEAIAPVRVADLCPPLDLAGIPRALRPSERTYRRGDHVFHPGLPADRVHLVERGWIRIAFSRSDGRDGTLAVLGPGTAFGEPAILDGLRGAASALALEPSTVLTADGGAFRALVAAHPTAQAVVRAGVTRWLGRLTQQVAELHFLDVRCRLAAALLRIAEEAGVHDGPMTLPILTQSDLASLAATTRQRVNGALGELVREGVVTRDGQRMQVRDVRLLAARVHPESHR